MTTGEKILTGFVILLIVTGIYFLGTAQGWWRNIFVPATSPAPETSDFEKCTEANKSKIDGTPCSNCVAEGSGQPNFNGVIKDGECVVKPASAPAPTIKRYIIGNNNGAIVYLYQGGVFIAPKSKNTIPYATEIKLVSASPNHDYYLTDKGWVSAKDIVEKLI